MANLRVRDHLRSLEHRMEDNITMEWGGMLIYLFLDELFHKLRGIF